MLRNEKVTIVSVMILVATINNVKMSEKTEKALAKSLLKSAICTKYDRPTIAMSPARLIQAIALTKKLQNERRCKTIRNKPKFDIDNPTTWQFCAAGRCFDEECFCYSMITGSKCEKFNGNCWMVFCSPRDCKNRYIRQLECQCEVQIHTFVVITGEYWYDEGLEHTYRRPTIESDTADFFEMQITLNYTALQSAIQVEGASTEPNFKRISALDGTRNEITSFKPEKIYFREFNIKNEKEIKDTITADNKKKLRVVEDANKDIGRSIILEQENDEMDYISFGKYLNPEILIVFICLALIYSFQSL